MKAMIIDEKSSVVIEKWKESDEWAFDRGFFSVGEYITTDGITKQLIIGRYIDSPEGSGWWSSSNTRYVYKIPSLPSDSVGKDFYRYFEK